MTGFQFVHIETYSRKAGKSGRTVSNVLDEAQRRPEACTHVSVPSAPTVVFGCNLDDLRARHDQVVAAGRSMVVGGKSRAIRSDQHTLLTIIASHPATSDQVAADPAAAADVDAWQARVVEWMQGLWGERLQSVIRHDDEGHPHLHAYVLPDAADAKAKSHHPGCIAKDDARAIALALGSDAKAANAKGDAAYKTAMRAMQDGYFERVGIASGMARLGPGRRRLDRGAWQAEQAQARSAGTALAAAELARVEASNVTGVAVEIRRAAEVRAAELHAQGLAYVQRARETAAAAVAAADAAGERVALAQRAEADARRAAAQVLHEARREAAGILRAAEARAARLGRLGELLGVGWLGLSGARQRVEAHAARQVARARDEARAGIAGALESARGEVRGELTELRADAFRQRAEAQRAQDQVVDLAVKLDREHAARAVAERQRDIFQERWAEADNALIAVQHGHR